MSRIKRNIYFVSDFHFGHSNIIKYEKRPFSNVEEMDSFMIRKWNKTVRPSDVVWVLGDFSFYGREKTTSIVHQLNGIKYLVVGNHDRRRNNRWWKEVGFTKVYDRPIVWGDFYLLSHEPLYTNAHCPYVNIHGHIHSKTIQGAQNFNVSVEVLNYTPILFEEIKQKIGVQEV